MWSDILPSKEYAVKYIKALRTKNPYDDIRYEVSQRHIYGKIHWGIYNPRISLYEFVWVPSNKE